MRVHTLFLINRFRDPLQVVNSLVLITGDSETIFSTIKIGTFKGLKFKLVLAL